MQYCFGKGKIQCVDIKSIITNSVNNQPNLYQISINLYFSNFNIQINEREFLYLPNSVVLERGKPIETLRVESLQSVMIW
jgi:hypothetical protein